MNREPSTAFDRAVNPVEAALYDADPVAYRPPVWVYPPSPYDVPACFRFALRLRGGVVSPQRIQRKRTRGWRMPDGAVYVGRPTVFGNPFRPVKVGDSWLVIDDNDVDYQPFWNTRQAAVDKALSLFVDDLTYWFGGRIKLQPGLADAVAGLRGHDLACWCPLDQPCHADVLLELANGGET